MINQNDKTIPETHALEPMKTFTIYLPHMHKMTIILNEARNQVRSYVIIIVRDWDKTFRHSSGVKMNLKELCCRADVLFLAIARNKTSACPAVYILHAAEGGLHDILSSGSPWPSRIEQFSLSLWGIPIQPTIPNTRQTGSFPSCNIMKSGG